MSRLYKRFFAQMIDHKDEPLSFERLQEIIGGAETMSELIMDMNRFWQTIPSVFEQQLRERQPSGIRYWCRVPKGKLNTKHMDGILSMRVQPGEQLTVRFNGFALIRATGDAHGEINLDQPILIPPLCYEEILLDCGQSEHVHLEAFTCLGLAREELFTSTKAIPWKFHASMEEPIVYYRGLCVSWSARNWIF